MSQTLRGAFVVENTAVIKDFVESGTFRGTGTPPVVFPGQTINFKFHAGKGQRLMFTTMYGASKDWFFAPENPGIALYNESGLPITGDISNQIKLWDNGSKDNMTGAVESKPITMVTMVNASSLMKLNLSYQADLSEFTLSISNTSGGTTNETPFSPGVWAISNVLGGALLNNEPFYKMGMLTNPEITAIAEGGNNIPLATKTMTATGVITGLSPVLIVVYQGNMNPIFQAGTKDMNNGLKEVAQMGDPAKLKNYLMQKQGIKKVYVAGDAPIAPGAKVSVQIESNPGDKIAYVTMFGYSNDWFYANEGEVSAQTKGDLTAKTALFNDGTAVDQYPGAGNNQALFGGKAILESKDISKVGTMYPVPQVSSVIKVSYQ